MITCPKCAFANPDEANTCAFCGAARYIREATVATLEPSASSSPSDQTPVASPQSLTFSFRTPAPRPAFIESKPATSAPGTVFDIQPQPMPPPVEPTLRHRANAINFHSESDDVVVAMQASSIVPADSTMPPVRAKLVVLRGVKIGAEYPIYDGRNTVGRFVDKPVDVDLLSQESVEQTWCSRVHANVTYDKSVAMIEDLNSLNGTWINGTRIHPGQPRVLKPNDVIQIGTVQLKLLMG